MQYKITSAQEFYIHSKQNVYNLLNTFSKVNNCNIHKGYNMSYEL